jgi:Flp pilus assembly protein TadG
MISPMKAFLKERSANVALIFAMALAPVSAAVGGALDFTRTFTIGSEIQSALDTGVLAASSLSQRGDPETVVRAYLEAAIAEHSGVIESLVVTVTPNVALNAREVHATASVSVPTTLLGVAGIRSLTMDREAEATEQVQNIEVSLLLDISGSMRGYKIDALRAASAEFIETVFASDTANLTSFTIVPYGGQTRVGAPLLGLIDPAAGVDAASWNGCVELDEDAITAVDLDAGAFEPVPHFHTYHTNRIEFWCPGAANTEVSWNSGDSDALKAQVLTFDNPSLVDGTGTGIAIGWAVRALDPVWRGRLPGDFPDRPVDYDEAGTMKVLIVMTDGAVNDQYRPPEGFPEEYDRESSWPPFYVHPSDREVFVSRNDAFDDFTTWCDYAKDNGVSVYSIAFQVSGGSNRSRLRDCATAPELYYRVENLNIAGAFSAIAADMNRLRLSR